MVSIKRKLSEAEKPTYRPSTSLTFKQPNVSSHIAGDQLNEYEGWRSYMHYGSFKTIRNRFQKNARMQSGVSARDAT